MRELVLHRRVQKGLRGLPGSVRHKVSKSLSFLQNLPKDELLRNPHVHALKLPDEKLYSFKATPKLRLIFIIEKDKTYVLDIASHDALKRYFKWREE